MLALGQAKANLAQYAQGGMCVTDSRLPGEINRAAETLFNKENFPGTITVVRMCIQQRCVTLPREIGKILKYRINGELARVFDKWYEFAEVGPQSEDEMIKMDLLDRGKHPTQYELSEPMRLALMSDSNIDSGVQITIRGLDDTGREVRGINGQFGEIITLEPETLTVTQNTFAQITGVFKPLTAGYVWLSGISFNDDGDEMDREHLSAYHPYEFTPEYRRYEFPSSDCGCTTPRSYELLALVKLAFVPAALDTDIVLVDNLGALSFMMQANRYYDAGQIREGDAFEQLAEKRLIEGARNDDSGELTIDYDVSVGGLGDIPSV